jgi:4-alpha-glucanotransferase
VTSEDLLRRAEAHGVMRGFHVAGGDYLEPPASTLRAVLETMGVDPEADEPPRAEPWPPVLVVRQGEEPDWRPPERCELVLEDGGRRAIDGAVGSDLPLGYHDAIGASGSTRLIVVPHAAYLPADVAAGHRVWGLATQLYAARSRSSWGIGDLCDLERVAALAPEAGFVLLNPMHTFRPNLPLEPSPYSPSSRLFRSPLHLCVEAVPEVAALTEPARALFLELAQHGHALNAAERIDRDAIYRLKDDALHLLHGALSDVRRAALRAFVAANPPLEAFATFNALCEQHGSGWTGWPLELWHPDNAAVARWREAHPREVEYHAYVQWLLAEQLAGIARPRIGYVADLAIGVAADGFDAWLWQEATALQMSVGAPPDPLGPLGQNWQLPPWIPQRLRDAAYEPFVQTIRENLRGAGGLRIDHVMGLGRLFWIPEGAPTAAGCYVRYPFEDLLGILALESHRARALVIGEDLGTIDDHVRWRLGESRVLSYRLAWFEQDWDGRPRDPQEYPGNALAAVSTHDLPTVAGFFGGRDIVEQERAGSVPEGQEQAFRDEAAARGRRLLDHLVQHGLLEPGDDDPHRISLGLYRLLARTPCLLVSASLDDLTGAVLRPNMPGTIDTYPNWSIPLPAPLDELPADERVRALVAALGEERP